MTSEERSASQPEPNRSLRPRHCWWTLVAILLLALGLRGWQLGSDSMWQDEALVWLHAASDPDATVRVLASQNQPPGYHLMLRGWMLVFGFSDVATRAFSVLFGVLAVALLYALGWRLLGAWTGFAASMIGATSTFWVLFSREATMYSLTLALGLGSAVLFLELARETERRTLVSTLAGWLTLGALRAALLYVHYFGLFLIAGELAVAAWIAVRRRSARIAGGWILAHLLAFVAFLPWLATFLDQQRRVAEFFWTQEISLGRTANVFRQWLLYLPEVDHWPWILVLALPAAGAAAALVGLAKLLKDWWGKTLEAEAAPLAQSPAEGLEIALLYFVAPLAIAFVASVLSRPLFEPKYLIVFSSFFYLLIPEGLSRLGPVARNSALLAVIAGNLVGVGLLLGRPGYRNPDIEGATRHILAHWQPGDAILTLQPEELAGVARYSHDAVARPLYLYSPNGPWPFWQGLNRFPPSAFIADAELLAGGQERVWVLAPFPTEKWWEFGREEQEAYEAAAYQLILEMSGMPPPEPVSFNKLRLYRVKIERDFDYSNLWRKWFEWRSEGVRSILQGPFGDVLRERPGEKPDAGE